MLSGKDHTWGAMSPDSASEFTAASSEHGGILTRVPTVPFRTRYWPPVTSIVHASGRMQRVPVSRRNSLDETKREKVYFRQITIGLSLIRGTETPCCSLRRLSQQASRITKPVPSTSDIIAATDFNLWRELCKPAYAGVFWAKRVPLAFPHVTVPGKERDILTAVHRKVDLLLKLRNRIVHHEPIIGSNWEKIGAKLEERHADAIELLQWMHPDFAMWVLSRDTFETVASARPV
jgi:hypothetical protein